MLEHKKRYLQIAFNSDLAQAMRVLPLLPKHERIIIEAGTPFIKREGIRGISTLKAIWGGEVVADIKTSDGAAEEASIAAWAGATAATVLGSSPIETLNLFILKCSELGIASMIDMLGVEEPLRVLMNLKKPPTVVILHKGRDEESTRGKTIQYRHVNRIRSKFDVIISAAGGVDLKEASSAIFNGANIVVVNVVDKTTNWTGLDIDENITEMAQKFLNTIE